MRTINKIIIHAAYTPPGQDIGVAEIRRWHVEGNGWSDIGYHYVIRRNGVVEEGRPLEQAGAHVAGHNHDSIGICLVGGELAGAGPQTPDCNYTAAQWAALEALVGYFAKRFPDAVIRGHRDYDSSKACPCFDVEAWWAQRLQAGAA